MIPGGDDSEPAGRFGDADEAVLRLLERIVAGHGTPADHAGLARWVAERPERQRIVDALRAQCGAVPEAHDVDAGWARLAARIRPPHALPAAVESRSDRPFGAAIRRRRSPLRIAVGIAAAAAVAAVAIRFAETPTPAAVPAIPRVYATPVGRRAEIRLADGTRVQLAPESRLRLAADFGTQRRDLYLDGEAYFEVAHDSTRPFTVFAANTSTRDIGTMFAVRSYPGEGSVRVVVREGMVALSGAGLLRAGDVGRLTADGAASVRHHADVAALLSWTQGELVFADAPLSQVLADMRRWYDGRMAEVRVADGALDSLPFTGSLRGLTPDQGVALVAATLGLHVERHGSSVLLRRR